MDIMRVMQMSGCAAVSVWKTTSRLDKGSSKEVPPTFNCLLLQFGVVAQGVQELMDTMCEVEHQPAGTILQVSFLCHVRFLCQSSTQSSKWMKS